MTMLDPGVLVGALLLSILHSVIPTHWAPFVVVGKWRNWSRTRQAAVTFGAAFIHSLTTITIGVAIAYTGITFQTDHRSYLEAGAAGILIVLGLILVAGRLLNRHLHGHFDPARFQVKTAATEAMLITALVGMLSLSPCAEIIPLFLLAAGGGWESILALSAVTILVTSCGMTAVVVISRDGISNVRWKSIEENAGLIAGILLLAIGLFALSDLHEDALPSPQLLGRIGLSILVSAWAIFQEAAPYILFGCLMGGLVYAFVRPERVARYLGKGRYRPVINAALIGVPLPLCSCGVIPTALGLRRMGATRGATTAFLITTPETGIDSIAVTYALLGPIYAVFRPLAAFVTGVTAGVIEVLYGVKDSGVNNASGETCDRCSAPSTSPLDSPPKDGPKDGPMDGGRRTILERLKLAVTYGLGDFLQDMSLWLVIGFLAAGVILVAAPPTAIEGALGGGLSSLLIVLVISIPLYICASATTPLAAALLMKGASPGAALVLLLAGPASNTAGIIMLAKFLGKRSVIIYVLSIAICSLAAGMILNGIFAWLDIDPKIAIGAHQPHRAGEFSFWCAVGLSLLVAGHLLRQIAARVHGKDTPDAH